MIHCTELDASPRLIGRKNRMKILLSLGCGALVALMVECNGQLQEAFGSLSSLVLIHLVGLAAAAVYHTLNPSGGDPEFDPRGAPWWFLSAGILGIGVVLLNMVVFVRAGILLALGGTLAGQTLTAYVVELSPWNRSERSPVIQRVMVLTLIVPGTVVIGVQSGVGALWIALSFLPGAILVVQSMFNSYNSSRWGHPRMLIFNYVSALIILLPLIFIVHPSAPLSIAALSKVPLYFLLGGGILGVTVVGTITHLLKISSPVKTFLGLYTGQLATGVLLDGLREQAVQPEKLGGVLLVAAGLFAGEINRYLRQRNSAAAVPPR
jgi:transporter family-2 protein